MEDQVTDNQTVDNGSPDNNGAGNISDIMTSMAGKAEPEEKAVTSEESEGEEESGEDKADLPAWTSQLPEELRSNTDVMKQLTKFGKIGDLAKSYSELEKKLGSSLVKPGENSSDEEKEAFYRKLGKPESAAGYEIEDKDGILKELAFKHNLTNEQAKALFTELNALGQKQIEDSAKAVIQQAADTEKSLRDEYGNKYETKLEMLKRGVQAYGGPQLAKALQDAGLLANEIIVRHFIKLGEMNAEAGTFNKGEAAPEKYKSTAEGGTFTFKGLK